MHYKSSNVLEFCLYLGFVHAFICREPAMMCMNNQGLTNLYRNVMFCIQCCFWVPLKHRWVVSLNSACEHISYLIIFIAYLVKIYYHLLIFI